MIFKVIIYIPSSFLHLLPPFRELYLYEGSFDLLTKILKISFYLLISFKVLTTWILLRWRMDSFRNPLAATSWCVAEFVLLPPPADGGLTE